MKSVNERTVRGLVLAAVVAASANAQLQTTGVLKVDGNVVDTRKMAKLTVKVDRPQLSPDEIKKLEMAQRNNQASE